MKYVIREDKGFLRMTATYRTKIPRTAALFEAMWRAKMRRRLSEGMTEYERRLEAAILYGDPGAESPRGLFGKSIPGYESAQPS
jgi:hypothetical protein